MASIEAMLLASFQSINGRKGRFDINKLPPCFKFVTKVTSMTSVANRNNTKEKKDFLWSLQIGKLKMDQSVKEHKNKMTLHISSCLCV